MDSFKLISVLLLITVVMDAVGDAFRTRKWQVLHHIAEVVVIAVWMIIAKLPVPLVVMYIVSRIAFFDPLYNFVSGMPLKYIGNSSLYDRFLRKFMLWVGEPGMLIWVIRALCLYWWLTWFFTNAGGRI